MAEGDSCAKPHSFDTYPSSILFSSLHQDRRTSSLPLLALPGVTSSSEDHPGKLLSPCTQRYSLPGRPLCPLNDQEKVFCFSLAFTFLKHCCQTLRFGFHRSMRTKCVQIKPSYVQVFVHQVWCSSACVIWGLNGHGTQLFQWWACATLNRQVATAGHRDNECCTHTPTCLRGKLKSYRS